MRVRGYPTIKFGRGRAGTLLREVRYRPFEQPDAPDRYHVGGRPLTLARLAGVVFLKRCANQGGEWGDWYQDSLDLLHELERSA